jgi:hypothetical protein
MPRSRSRRKPLLIAVVTATVTATVLTASAGSALTARTVASTAAAASRLTADTPAGCNRPQPPGDARCFAVIATPADHRIIADSAGPPAGALGPAQIQAAYKLPATGNGETVALVDAYGDSAAQTDLAVFRSHYGLPACTAASHCFRKVNQEGKSGDYPASNGGWALETSLDLDTVSAACPKCNILLVEAKNQSFANLGAGVDEAVHLGAKFVSNSYGLGESASYLKLDRDYDHPGVAVTASAGDSGYGVDWPASSPYVTAVGGTTLTRDGSVPRGWKETVWNGTGSGCSRFEPKPADQDGINTDCAKRAVADLSADADPSSGLAVYDTLDNGGWLQVGGTSLSSPLIASGYALAGTPVAGTDPASYPYHDPHQASDLNDVTHGANGGCGTLLCRAGPGWDGPTGLGTPDGVKALTSGPHGQITGRVTSKATGKPLAGAVVSANPGNYVTRTETDGSYDLNVAAGAYHLTAAGYGYRAVSRAGVRVAARHTVTASFALAAEPGGLLSGTVTDGSGHGWPLLARVTISGRPGGAIWTSAVTGRYRVALPQGSYTMNVGTYYPGYRSRQLRVTVGSSTTRDVALPVDTTCRAPGYGPRGLSQDFSGWPGGTARDGWKVSNAGRGAPGWRFDNPGNRPPPAHRWVRAMPGYPRQLWYFDSGQFAVADPGFYAPRAMHTTLTSPPVNLAGQAKPVTAFDSGYYRDGGEQAAQVQLSTDAGGHWATVWQRTARNALGPFAVPVPQAADHTRAEVRFVLTGRGGGYWAVGNVLIGTAGCVPQQGGLLTGVVTGQAGAAPVDGAQITTAARPQPQRWPAGTSLATPDRVLPGGFYWLFAPAGGQRVTAAAAGYASATARVDVTPNQVTRHNWALARAEG